MAEAEDRTQPPAAGANPRRPWSVFVPEKRGHPANPLRYSSTIPLAIGMALVAAFVVWIVFPTHSKNTEMHAIVADAAAGGIPQVPPAYATASDMQQFIEKWEISCSDTINGISFCQYLPILAEQHGEYRDNMSVLFLALVAGLVAALFIVAIAFSRALNNLYALGHDASEIPQAWALTGFFIPVLNLVLPWFIVDQIWRAAWSRKDGTTGSSRASVVAGLWGLVVIITAVLNPVTMSWFIPQSDISGWLTHLEWVNRSLMWVIVPIIFTTLLLMVVTWRQHRRFLQLDATARAQRVSAGG